jgi:hypothetical protein
MHGDAPAELAKQSVVTAATAVAGKVAEATASVVREL